MHYVYTSIANNFIRCINSLIIQIISFSVVCIKQLKIIALVCKIMFCVIISPPSASSLNDGLFQTSHAQQFWVSG